MEIKVKCRRCNKIARPDELVLDPDYKMMVCPLCIREKKTKEMVKKEFEAMKKEKEFIEEVEKKKPAGYDMEDEYLNRAYKRNMQETVTVERIDDDRVRYICPKCKYKFQYDITKKYPARCPYCDAKIARIRY